MESRADQPEDWIIQLWNHVERQVEFGDAKAGQLLAADSILLAALVLLAGEFRDEVTAATSVVSLLVGLALGASILLVLLAVAPARRLLRSSPMWSNAGWARLLRQEVDDDSRRRNLVDFSSIADGSLDDYVSDASSVAASAVTRDLLRSIYGKSCWARHKFTLLDKAVKLSNIAVALALVATISESIARV